MTFTERQRHIFETAKQHGDMFLLRRRLRRGGMTTDLDLEYEACDALVASGHAERLPWNSDGDGLGPGIRLTGKPE